MRFKNLKLPLLALAMAAGGATTALAGPTYTFDVSTSDVSQLQGTIGTITLTQNGAYVDVGLDLAAGYGILNTGGPHTPFAFTISGSETGLSLIWTTPTNGIFNTNKLLTLNAAGGSNTPFGAFGVAIDSSAGNGSGNGYYGDLLFSLTRDGGLDTNDFIANSDTDPVATGVYFSADITNGTNTGAVAWYLREEVKQECTVNCESEPCPDCEVTEVPEPGTLALFGTALAGLAVMRRRRKSL